MNKHQILKLVCAGMLTIALCMSFARGGSPATQPAMPTATAPSQKYLRFVRDDHGGGATLQAAVVRYENAQHVSVDLVAAIHIADPSFYRALDASFDDYDAVLFERVQPKSAAKPPKKTIGIMLLGFSQYLMSDAMGLEHQLHGVRYKDRPNFIHADMDLETFQARQDARGESMFGGASKAAGKQSDADRDRMGREVLRALFAPDRAVRLKMAIGEMFGHTGDANVDGAGAGGDGAGGDGAEPTVLIDERNRVALGVLKDVLTNQPEKHTIAIFYGAGHLNGMSKILTGEMGFHQVGPPMWRIAWDIRPMVMQPAAPTQPNATPATDH